MRPVWNGASRAAEAGGVTVKPRLSLEKNALGWQWVFRFSDSRGYLYVADLDCYAGLHSVENAIVAAARTHHPRAFFDGAPPHCVPKRRPRIEGVA